MYRLTKNFLRTSGDYKYRLDTKGNYLLTLRSYLKQSIKDKYSYSFYLYFVVCTFL